ncbi:hypothetical protein GCM10017673_55080 [Streptosporangium violaceochromogenes]|nr:hypothetical protein GCM10017673_55080 [Streptosporangium violaceochromogenes]
MMDHSDAFLLDLFFGPIGRQGGSVNATRIPWAAGGPFRGGPTPAGDGARGLPTRPGGPSPASAAEAASRGPVRPEGRTFAGSFVALGVGLALTER